MAATIAGRSTSTFLRPIWRSTSSTTTTTSSRRISVSLSFPSTRSNLTLRQTRISPPSPSTRLVRRELSTFQPVHSAIAAACLVSKLPSEASTSTEGRFANYLSPI